MIKRVQRNAEPLRDALALHKTNVTMPTATELEKMKKLEAALEQCRYISELLGGEKYVSCSVVLPALCHLSRVMEVTEDDPSYMIKFKGTFTADLEARKEKTNGIHPEPASKVIVRKPKTVGKRCLQSTLYRAVPGPLPDPDIIASGDKLRQLESPPLIALVLEALSTLELVPSKFGPVPRGSPMSYQCPPEKSCDASSVSATVTGYVFKNRGCNQGAVQMSCMGTASPAKAYS
uniref:Uncharacterized protein n=1 Tax=Knipowitschia caucasica TaxID=637954 RepID=A0AAV2MH39_KNICA